MVPFKAGCALGCGYLVIDKPLPRRVLGYSVRPNLYAAQLHSFVIKSPQNNSKLLSTNQWATSQKVYTWLIDVVPPSTGTHSKTLIHGATNGKKKFTFSFIETICRPVLLFYHLWLPHAGGKNLSTVCDTIVDCVTLNGKPGLDDLALQFEQQTSLSTLSTIFIKQDYCCTQKERNGRRQQTDSHFKEEHTVGVVGENLSSNMEDKHATWKPLFCLLCYIIISLQD